MLIVNSRPIYNQTSYSPCKIKLCIIYLTLNLNYRLAARDATSLARTTDAALMAGT